VEGNAVSLYYAMQEDSTIIGLNRMESAYWRWIQKRTGLRIKNVFSDFRSHDSFAPVKTEETRLKEFVWLNYLRPTGPVIFSAGMNGVLPKLQNPSGRFEREDVTL
jgi:hypothetical protein